MENKFIIDITTYPKLLISAKVNSTDFNYIDDHVCKIQVYANFFDPLKLIFSQFFNFYTPWKRQKTFGFSEGIEMEQFKMG